MIFHCLFFTKTAISCYDAKFFDSLVNCSAFLQSLNNSKNFTIFVKFVLDRKEGKSHCVSGNVRDCTIAPRAGTAQSVKTKLH